jgi:hypothetical protein
VQWYDEHFTEADLLRGWDNVLDICKDKVSVRVCACGPLRIEGG